MNKKESQQGGYAIIVSVVVIATVLLMLATMSARRVQDAFFVALDLGNVTQARALAEGCAYEALLKRATDSQYSGNEQITIGENTCTIQSISGQIIDVEAMYNDSNYRIRIQLTTDEPPEIYSWTRVDAF